MNCIENTISRPGLSLEQLQAINTRYPTHIEQLIDLHNSLPIHHRTEHILELACKCGIDNFYRYIEFLKPY